MWGYVHNLSEINVMSIVYLEKIHSQDLLRKSINFNIKVYFVVGLNGGGGNAQFNRNKCGANCLT